MGTCKHNEGAIYLDFEFVEPNIIEQKNDQQKCNKLRR